MGWGVCVATGKTDGNGTPEVMVLVTNRLDLDADLVALAYRSRWAVELFCRWVKCVLGCRHLLSQTATGVRMQVDVALIASRLIRLWVGRAPTKRTYEMRCFYRSGWAVKRSRAPTSTGCICKLRRHAKIEPNTIGAT